MRVKADIKRDKVDLNEDLPLRHHEKRLAFTLRIRIELKTRKHIFEAKKITATS